MTGYTSSAYFLKRWAATFPLAAFAFMSSLSAAFAQQANTGVTQAIGRCDAGSLGGMFCQLQSSSVAQLLALVFGVAFIGGVFLVVKGLIALMKVSDAGSAGTPLSSPLLMIGAGAFLVAFPATIMVGLGTFGGDGIWDYGVQDRVGDANGQLGSDDFLSMIGNFAINAAGPLSTLVMGVAVLIGVILVASAIFGFANMNAQKGGQEGFGALGTKLAIGIGLVNIFWLMDVIGASFGLPGGDANSLTDITDTAWRYSTAATADGASLETRYDNVLRIAFLALIPFGLIAFVRGLLIIKDAASGNRQASFGAGATHIIGGVALVNAEAFSCAVMKTLTGATTFCLTNPPG